MTCIFLYFSERVCGSSDTVFTDTQKNSTGVILFILNQFKNIKAPLIVSVSLFTLF